MTEVTPAQGRYLAYIRAYTDGFGLPPAESEIAEAIGVSPLSVNQMMKTLERKGLIRRRSGVPRSIEILVADDAIPKWKGKRLTHTVRKWTLSSPAARRLEQASDGKATVVYCFKIILQDKGLTKLRVGQRDRTKLRSTPTIPRESIGSALALPTIRPYSLATCALVAQCSPLQDIPMR